MVKIVKLYLVNVALVASGSSLSLPKVLLCLEKTFKLFFFNTVAIFFGKFYFFSCLEQSFHFFKTFVTL